MSWKPLLCCFVMLTSSSLSWAQVGYGHNRPVTHAVVEFAPDFPALVDSEWDFPLGGFGGVRRGQKPGHVPVIFVHGNNVDACDWKLVRDDFRADGWSDQALWALSYNGLGNDVGNEPSRSDDRCSAEHAEHNGGDSVSRITGNDVNVADLYAFILAVRRYTESDQFSIVSHSLGVTLARKTLKVYPELRTDLVAFVGIAGGNHGTSLCPPGSAGVLYSCDELEAGSAWLTDLNGPNGEDETFAPARWLTIYDGSGSGDVAYAPGYEHSPALTGAENRQFPGASHNGLRVDAEIVKQYREFLEQAENDMQPYSSTNSGAGTLSIFALCLLTLSRRRLRDLILGFAVFCVPALAMAAPTAAKAEFPKHFSPPIDAELQAPLGGFGADYTNAPQQAPVIFVHGNTSDACDWKLVRDDFIKAGWNPGALWALSYHGVGAGKSRAPARPDARCVAEQTSQAGLAQITSNDVNVSDLGDFIQAVRRYTGHEKFALVAHSLGVTLARKTLQQHPSLKDDLIAFVGIAGANHGTSLCPPGSEKSFAGCAEMRQGSDWLARLNGTDGGLETYPPARWMSIYDGSGEADIAFAGPLASSPALKGAENRRFDGVTHNDLRVRADIVTAYRQFIENAIAASAHRQRLQRLLIGK